MNMEQRIKRLEQEMEPLKRKLRLHRNLAFALAVALMTAGAIAAANQGGVADVIRVRGIEVVDANGQVVVRLLGWKHGGALQIFNEKGFRTLLAAQLDNGDGNLEVANRLGKSRFEATHDDADGGMLRILNGEGKAILEVIQSTRGNGRLSIYDANGKLGVRASGASLDRSGGFLEIFNKTGESVVQLDAKPDGSGAVGAFNRQGVGRELRP